MKPGVEIIAEMREYIQNNEHLIPTDEIEAISLMQYAAARLNVAADSNLSPQARIGHLASCGAIIAEVKHKLECTQGGTIKTDKPTPVMVAILMKDAYGKDLEEYMSCLAAAGALIAAEIDRLNNSKQK